MRAWSWGTASWGRECGWENSWDKGPENEEQLAKGRAGGSIQGWSVLESDLCLNVLRGSREKKLGAGGL